MTARKAMYVEMVSGRMYQKEVPITDTMALGGLALSGALTMGTAKITGLGAAAGANDAIAYGQASASLAGLALTGALTMATNKITGCGAAAGANDVIVYGQASASLAGLTLTGALAMGTNKITGLGAPADPTDASTKAYVDSAVISGGHVKELLLHESQKSDTYGILGCIALNMGAVPIEGDTIVITNGTTTRTYGAGTGGDVQYVIGGTAAITMTNLAAAITGDASGAWDAAVSTDLDAIAATTVVIYEADNTIAASKIYGVWATPADCKVVNFGGESEYSKKALTNLPASAPGTTNFGFFRIVGSMAAGEIHYVENNDVVYAWDDDANKWNTMTGPYSIPDATSGAGGATKGKVTFDSDKGLYVSTGIAEVKLEANKGLAVTSAGVKGVANADKAIEVGASGFGIVVEANKGLAVTSSGIKTVIEASKGLTVGESGLAAVADTAKAIELGGSGIGITLGADPGLKFDTGLKAKIEANKGLSVGANGIAGVANADKAIEVGASGFGIVVEASKGLAVTSSGIKTVIEASKGLTVGADGLAGVANNAKGIEVGASGFGITIEASNPSMQLTSNELGLKIYASGGLQKTADGTGLKLNGTTLQMSGDGVSVKGVPSLFEIGGNAVSANVTHTNLNTLTAGATSNADALHTHAGDTLNATVAEAVVKADPLCQFTTADKVHKALATTDAKADVIGLAYENKAQNADVKLVRNGDIGGGFIADGVAGTPYYLQDAGGIGTAYPSAGSRLIQVGFAKNATDLWVKITDFGKLAAA